MPAKSATPDGPGDSLAGLQELATLQRPASSALVRIAGAGTRPPDEAYERYLGLAEAVGAGASATATTSATSPAGDTATVSCPDGGYAVAFTSGGAISFC